MFDLILIPHKEVANRHLEEIIRIKSDAWHYSFDRQLEWINANLKETDIHVLLSLNGKNVAYLNLIEIELILDSEIKKGYGVGNVCASEKGKGWGKEIMAQTNLYLTKSNKVGLLFCKNSLISFYSLNNWVLIEKIYITLSFNNEFIETMVFNCENEFQILEYVGKPF